MIREPLTLADIEASKDEIAERRIKIRVIEGCDINCEEAQIIGREIIESE